jgi:3-isopropylmalate dehydrogenase
LSHGGHEALARRVEAAVEYALLENRTTPDLGGSLSTEQVGDFICDAIATGARSPERDPQVGV